jgi:hypothetical protein
VKFSMTVPCGNCPFRKTGGIRLHPSRAREIGKMMLHPGGGMFPCHKSVDYEKADPDSGDHAPTPGEVHCAGALIFAEKNGNATQMMRISERFGDYDHRKLTDESTAMVFDSLSEMVAAQGKRMAKSK